MKMNKEGNRDTQTAIDGPKTRYVMPKGKDNQPMKRLQMNVEATLHTAIKIQCVKDEREITDVIKELLIGYLLERDPVQWKGIDRMMPDK